MSRAKRRIPNEITLLDIEQEIKRALSDREVSAILNCRGQLPDDRRKRKRLIRKARERARREDLKDPSNLAAPGEPTDLELRMALDLLSAWQTPSLFKSTLVTLRRRVPIRKLMSRKYQRMREAIVLSTFCENRKVLAIRLGEDPPDGRVRFEVDDDTPVEVTEALEDRKRTEDYRDGAISLLSHISDDGQGQLTDQMLQELERRVAAKVGKYDAPPLLLVYLNFRHDQRADKKIEETLQRLRKKHAGEFKEIHVVTDRKFF
jgi:hypothetical protein